MKLCDIKIGMLVDYFGNVWVVKDVLFSCEQNNKTSESYIVEIQSKLVSSNSTKKMIEHVFPSDLNPLTEEHM